MARILVIDDDEIMLTTLEHLLTNAGHQVATATDGHKAARLVQHRDFDLILTDLVMPNREGLETIIALRRAFPQIKVFAMSGGLPSSMFYLSLASRLGAHRTFAKPFAPAELLQAIDVILHRPAAG